MSSLQSLPDELLLEIALNIQSNRDVVAFALQCRRFHGLCDLETRRKYRRVKIGSRGTNELFKLLFSILHRPRRGLYVRHMEFLIERIWAHGFEWEMRNSEMSVSAPELARLKKAINDAGFGGLQEAKVLNMILENERVSFGNMDNKNWYFGQAVAALIISLAPRLESLDLGFTGWTGHDSSYGPAKLRDILAEERGDESWSDDRILHRLLLKMNAQGNDALFLRNLKTVKFLNYEDEERVYESTDLYGQLNSIRRLPGLEAVRFDAVENDRGDRFVPCPPRLANYSKIEILHSVVDDDVLCGIINSPRVLRHFAYKVGGRAFLQGDVRSLDPDPIYAALLLHRDTLEHLDLDIEYHLEMLELFDEEYRKAKKDERRRDREEENEDEESGGEAGPQKEEYWSEWEDELEEERRKESLQQSRRVASPTGPRSLKGFHRLKHLAIGARLLYYYVRILENDHGDDEFFLLADHLPPNLESLIIYDYKKGSDSDPDEEGGLSCRLGNFDFSRRRVFLDKHMSNITTEMKKKLPALKSVQGIEEMIPGGKTSEEIDVDEEDDDKWLPEEEEWTDYNWDSSSE